ncbi:hypothetical protein L1987_35719 [Smallanthus sonchifolius]|uniref:Uncharacterized protein n=1 Tax=Smallanthus sonchifolius TaxID=185202 RepID=A0ACB9HCW3_9ASTR|nr:hypothetical protein L1987_35719 [Smallanthus sonchifolius]
MLAERQPNEKGNCDLCLAKVGKVTKDKKGHRKNKISPANFPLFDFPQNFPNFPSLIRARPRSENFHIFVLDQYRLLIL